MVTPPDPDRELAELRAYLGDAFDERLLHGHVAALERELATVRDEDRLYRSSHVYLYDLTAFAMSRTKEPYLELLARALPPPARVLDMGCGIGSDGLALAQAGYEVHFADFANPSTRYLRWRLERRGLHAPIWDLDADPPPAGFDLAYAFDVVEHVPDPEAFLTTMEARAQRVLVNLLEPEPGETVLHHRLDVKALLCRSAGRRLVRHRRLHGRSHLVLYDVRPARGLRRVRSALELLRR